MVQVSGWKQFVTVVPAVDLVALNARVDRSAAVEREWLREAREREGVDLLRGAALSEARRRIRGERAALRARGRLRQGRTELMVPALRAELAARGFVREWEDVPEGERAVPGRPWGVTGGVDWGLLDENGGVLVDEEGEGEGRPPRLAVELPVELAETVIRAAYWTSAPAVEALREWDAEWGDGPVVQLRQAARRNEGRVTDLDFILAVISPRPTADALVERERLRGEIVTTGDLIRGALARAIA